MEGRKQLAILAIVMIIVIAVCVTDRARALALVTLVLALFAAMMQYGCCAAPREDMLGEQNVIPGAHADAAGNLRPHGADVGDPLEYLAARGRHNPSVRHGLPADTPEELLRNLDQGYEALSCGRKESFMTYPGAVSLDGASSPPGPSTYGHGEHVGDSDAHGFPQPHLGGVAAHREDGYPVDGDRFGESGHPGFAGNGGHPHAGLDTDAVGGVTADEMVVYHARHRNDPRGVNADPGRHKLLMNKYFREELDEEEDSHWWGRHEM